MLKGSPLDVLARWMIPGTPAVGRPHVGADHHLYRLNPPLLLFPTHPSRTGPELSSAEGFLKGQEGEVLLLSVGIPDQRSSVTSSFLHGSRKDHLHALCQTRQPTPHAWGFTEGKQLSKTLEILAFRWYN